jgi:hypothetical protein
MLADFPTHMPQLKRARQRLSTASKFKLGRHRTDAVGDLIDTHFFFLAIFVILGFRPA